ncbi:MAG: hypothetical protein KJ561_08425 [Nanoarchaeota archaeon]|nr:hypothetical protein [Nanoarchaeota archaeon]
MCSEMYKEMNTNMDTQYNPNPVNPNPVKDLDDVRHEVVETSQLRSPGILRKLVSWGLTMLTLNLTSCTGLPNQAELYDGIPKQGSERFDPSFKVDVYNKRGIKRAYLVDKSGKEVYDLANEIDFSRYHGFTLTIPYDNDKGLDPREEYVLVVEDKEGNITRAKERSQANSPGIDNVVFRRTSEGFEIKAHDRDGISAAKIVDEKGNVVYRLQGGRHQLDVLITKSALINGGIDPNINYSLSVGDNAGNREVVGLK